MRDDFEAVKRIRTGQAMENVVVVVGAGQIGQAIARRVGVGKHVVLADRSEANANAAAEVMAQRWLPSERRDRRRVLTRDGACSRR